MCVLHGQDLIPGILHVEGQNLDREAEGQGNQGVADTKVSQQHLDLPQIHQLLLVVYLGVFFMGLTTDLC